jgi:uncharacterized protein YjiS (DUF1127 family)
MSITQSQAPLGWHRISPQHGRGRTRSLVGRALAAVSDWRRRAKARSQLAALDERTLHDLGLSRSDTLYLTSKAGEHDPWIDSLRFPPF